MNRASRHIFSFICQNFAHLSSNVAPFYENLINFMIRWIRLSCMTLLRIHPGNPQKCPTRSPNWCELFFCIYIRVFMWAIDSWNIKQNFVGGANFGILARFHGGKPSGLWQNFVNLEKNGINLTFWVPPPTKKLSFVSEINRTYKNSKFYAKKVLTSTWWPSWTFLGVTGVYP